MMAGGHRGLGANSVGATYAGRITVDIADLASDGILVVNAYLSNNAQVLGLAPLDLKEAAADASLYFTLPFLTREETLCVAVGHELHFFRRRSTAGVASLSSKVTQLICSAQHTRSRLVVAMHQGGVILWGQQAEAPQTPFASDMVDPRITLTRRGWLLAASKDEIDVYETAGGQLRLHARTSGNGMAPLATLSTHNVNQFGLVYPDGRVAIYQVPQS
jgi:hypothetical protein